ncbi:hypothetical protein QYE73_22865 [Pseudomonas mosselii]|uniref:hypothetical protein n=1 Tax=Pseudomonas mosselii TaxID=78327 RepID=UPI0026183102|nr:hypothetical protein [Pseudomonas mosselii]MDN4500134.1 hypothetical protein [Pseudomonas mosselii]
MHRPGKEPIPAPVPIPLTESMTIQLTLSGQDLAHFNAYREAVHALNPDNWSRELKQAYTGVSDQRDHYTPIKAKAGEALASALYEQAEAVIVSGQVPIELVPGHTQQPRPLYPLFLDAEQLQRVKALLEQASSREADPESPIFQILDEVRAARRRNPLMSLSPDTSTRWTPKSS